MYNFFTYGNKKDEHIQNLMLYYVRTVLVPGTVLQLNYYVLVIVTNSNNFQTQFCTVPYRTVQYCSYHANKFRCNILVVLI